MTVPAWGDEPDISDELSAFDQQPDEMLRADIVIGLGIKLKIAPDAFRRIMHTTVITAMVAERCEELADTANALAVINGARYTYVVSNRPENIRARGRVRPDNYLAVVDDAQNSTLLKALSQVGSDPYPSYPRGEDIDTAEHNETDLTESESEGPVSLDEPDEAGE
jgi:hypothetical protein